MAISSIGGAGPSPPYVPPQPASATPTAGATPDNATAAKGPTGPAAPDLDAPTKSPASSPSGSPSLGHASATTQSATGGDSFKINPDGTVGRLHIPRHPKSAGVIHA